MLPQSHHRHRGVSSKAGFLCSCLEPWGPRQLGPRRRCGGHGVLLPATGRGAGGDTCPRRPQHGQLSQTRRFHSCAAGSRLLCEAPEPGFRSRPSAPARGPGSSRRWQKAELIHRRRLTLCWAPRLIFCPPVGRSLGSSNDHRAAPALLFKLERIGVTLVNDIIYIAGVQDNRPRCTPAGAPHLRSSLLSPCIRPLTLAFCSAGSPSGTTRRLVSLFVKHRARGFRTMGGRAGTAPRAGHRHDLQARFCPMGLLQSCRQQVSGEVG